MNGLIGLNRLVGLNGLVRLNGLSGFTKGGTATAGVAAVGLLLAGCNASGDGVRSVGPPSETPTAKRTVAASPPPSAAPAYKKVDAVALVKNDSKAGSEVKRTLAKPCSANNYPIDVTYATLTKNSAPDVIVNVMTCADSVPIGAFVYRKNGKAYDNVYANEQQPVYAAVNKGELEVTKQTYDAADQVCCPSGEIVMSYRWADDHFYEYDRYLTNYSKTVDGARPEEKEG